MGSGNIEETVCNLMKQFGSGNISAIQSTLKEIDPELVKYSIDRFVDEGRNEFKKGNYFKAIESFSQAISGYKLQLSDKKQEKLPSCQVKNESDVKLELAKLFSNRSQCYIKLGGEENYINGFKDAKECILLDPNWSKGWYRAGKALYYLKIYDKATIVLKASLKREKKTESINSIQAIQEIEKLISICEKKADHDAAIKRVTVDYSRFEEAIKELENEELMNNGDLVTESENINRNENIINLPGSFNRALMGSNDNNQVENFQLELSPDLTKEEIDNIKMSLGGLSLNGEKDTKKKKLNRKINKITFNSSLKSKITTFTDDYDDNIKGISRLVQISSEIQWFKRIIENFVDKSNVYIFNWMKGIDIEIEKAKATEFNNNTVFIGSGSLELPIYFYNNTSNKSNLFTITQTKSNSSCIFRLYNNISIMNRVNVVNLNPLIPEFMSNVESSLRSVNSSNSEEASNSNKKAMKLIYGNVQNVPQEFWEKVNPNTIIIDPTVFEPGLLGYGLITNLMSIYFDKIADGNRISINPSTIKVYIWFANISIPNINVEELNNESKKTTSNDTQCSNINFDKLNEGLWSPYWEPLNLDGARSHINFISDPIELGTFPLERMINESSTDYFELGTKSNEYSDSYLINGVKVVDNNNINIYKGTIEYKIKSKQSINSIILTYKAIKVINEFEKDSIILTDTSSGLNSSENEYVVPPGIQWIGGIITNNNSETEIIKFDFQVEPTRITVVPNTDQINSIINPNNKSFQPKITNKFTCSLPRSVIENLWDTKTVEMWSKALINKYKTSVSNNTGGKVIECIVTSTSPGFFIPMTLLYISSKLNKSNNNSLYSTWKKSDVHFTCIENLPNLQELYIKVLKDNILMLLSDTVENEVRSLYNHNLSSSIDKGVTNNRYKNWKPISSINDGSDAHTNNNEQENIKFRKWALDDPSAKYILNKKLDEKLTLINGDVRQIVTQTYANTVNASNNGVQYHIINEKARIFTGMNFDHDGLGEGVIPLWATAIQNEIVRKYNNKVPNDPIPKRISFYGFMSQVGGSEYSGTGVDLSFWDTYRFEGNMKWVPISNTRSDSIIRRSDIFHILTIDLTSEGFKSLVDWKKEIAAKTSNEGRINSVIIFFDLWIDDFNILTTIPVNNISGDNYMQMSHLNVYKKESNIEAEHNKYCVHKTSFWKPTYHMVPQYISKMGDTTELEFSLENNFTKLKFSINTPNSSNERQGENTPSTIISDEGENSPLVLPPFGDVTFLQLIERYNSIIKDVSLTLYSTNTSVSTEAFNASLDLALNPSFYTGKNAIMKDDMLYDIDSLNWLCQSFLL